MYIDGDHSYSAVMLDIILWSQKVRDGGMISGHDYYRYQQGVKTAVDDYVRYHGAASREGANLRKADPKIELQLYKGHNWSWKM